MPATDSRNRLIHLKYTAISSTSKSLDCRCWLNGSLQSKRKISAYSFLDKWESKKYQSDIDIAHRVPARKPSNRPNAVICKFVRRLAKEKVMTARRAVRNIDIQQLGFSSEIDVTNLNIYDHLTPRLQNLLFEAKRCQKFQVLLGKERVCLPQRIGNISHP